MQKASLPVRAAGAVPEGTPRSGGRPHEQALSKSNTNSGGKQMPFQERHEGLSRRAPVEALHRTVVQHPVDALDLLVEDVVERTSLRKNFTHDAVPVLVRPPLPGMIRFCEVDLDAFARVIRLDAEEELDAVVDAARKRAAVGEVDDLLGRVTIGHYGDRVKVAGDRFLQRR